MLLLTPLYDAALQDGTFWSGSNYGLQSVDVAAPGVKCVSVRSSIHAASRLLHWTHLGCCGWLHTALLGSAVSVHALLFQVAAPSCSVLGLAIGGSYIEMTGTSMATPHVAGVAAIVLGK